MSNVCLLRHQTMVGYEFRQKEKSFKDIDHAWLLLENHPTIMEQPNFTCLPVYLFIRKITNTPRVFQKKSKECLYLANLSIASTLLERS